MKSIFLVLFAAAVSAQEIKPVTEWPKVINTAAGQTVNASVADCIQAGYRLLPDEPAVPEGKAVASRAVVQDPDNPGMAKIVVTFADAVPVKEEVLITVTADKVSFTFTENGELLSVKLIGDAKPGGLVEEVPE